MIAGDEIEPGKGQGPRRRQSVIAFSAPRMRRILSPFEAFLVRLRSLAIAATLVSRYGRDNLRIEEIAKPDCDCTLWEIIALN